MAGAVEIWLVDLQTALPALLALEADTGLLSEHDRAGVAGVVDQDTAVRRLAGVIGLRLLMSGLVGRDMASRPFLRSVQGKPRLPDGDCHFNLSHSGYSALIAFSTHPVGVDLESPRVVHFDERRRRLIEAAAVAIGDAAPLSGSNDQQRLLQAWTRLEALAKADGCGIGRVLTDIGAVGSQGRGTGEFSALLRSLSAEFITRDLTLDDRAIGAVSTSRQVTEVGSVRRLPIERHLLDMLLCHSRSLGQA